MDAPAPMHDNEFPITVDLVRGLLRSQFPRWAELPVERVRSTGTVNAIFRLGDTLAVRLPRTPLWHDIDYEIGVLDRVREVVPVLVPNPVAVGIPDLGYPWKWAIFEWIDGEVWSPRRLRDPVTAARQLASVIRALQSADTGGGRRSTRGGRTATARQNPSIRKAALEAGGMVATDEFLAVWDECRQARGWPGDPVWVHGDLLAPNVLVRDGSLHAVLDWAGASIGDPARDLAAAWNLFDPPSRRVFREELPFDDDTWARAKAWALGRITGVGYYANTNPEFSADAIHTIERVLNDGHP